MDWSTFQWLNESSVEEIDGGVTIEAPPKTDWFNGGGVPTGNAPFFYTEATGDFVFRARVSLEFVENYDACVLMAFQDEWKWVKACFEKTDFDTLAVVSVITNGPSDDANGPNVDTSELWLQICRVGKDFGVHYSLDGEQFFMMRYCTLDLDETLKVGLVAQSPLGDGGPRHFRDVTLESRTVRNIRAGK